MSETPIDYEAKAREIAFRSPEPARDEVVLEMLAPEDKEILQEARNCLAFLLGRMDKAINDVRVLEQKIRDFDSGVDEYCLQTGLGPLGKQNIQLCIDQVRAQRNLGNQIVQPKP